jgi:hypothetical protein
MAGPGIFPRCRQRSKLGLDVAFNVQRSTTTIIIMEQPPHGMPNILTQEQQNEMATQGYYPAEDLSAGLPINLDSLRDGPPGSKPFYPYSTLIRCVLCLFLKDRKCVLISDSRYAIKGSPNQKLLLEDIYYAIESRVGSCLV